MRELLLRFGQAGEVSVEQLATLYQELKTAKDATVNRWKERIDSKSGLYTIPSDKQENTVHTIRLEVR